MYPTILGSIAGDIIGSIYEFIPTKRTNFKLFSSDCTFTDDSVLTIAVADCLLNKKDFSETIWEYGNRYPGRGYGGHFSLWLLQKERKPYDSFGNGSGMRVSPIGFACKTMKDVLALAKQSAEVTHNHPEGIKGTQAIAAAIFLSKNGGSKDEIRDFLSSKFYDNLDRTIQSIRPNYHFDETCQGSVPEAIIAFLDSQDYESAIRLAISLGGDSDTIACMAGGIAAAFYKKVPKKIEQFAISKLPPEFIDIIEKFDNAVDNRTLYQDI